MKEQWKELLIKICVICDTAEDGHLNSYGESFYSSHKMFEEIKEGVQDFADSIQEIYFGSRELGFVSSLELRKAEIENLKTIKNEKDAARHIKDTMISVMELVKKIDENEDTTIGEKDLLSKIGGEIQQKLYFIQNFLK